MFAPKFRRSNLYQTLLVLKIKASRLVKDVRVYLQGQLLALYTMVQIFLTMIFGVVLRFVLAPTQTQGRLYPAILGFWEGACLRYLTNQLPSSNVDPFLSYAVRLCIDFFITDSFAQVLTIVLWTFLGALALEGVESGNSETANRPVAMQDGAGTSFTKIRTVSVSPFFSPSTSPSAEISSSPVFSPIGALANTTEDVYLAPSSPLPATTTDIPTPPVLPALPSEPSEARSPETYRSYTLPPPPPALVGEPSTLNEREVHIPLIFPNVPNIPILVIEREEPFQDELQTPLREADAPLADDDYDDELQTPLALPITNVGFDDLNESRDLVLGPSMLLGPDDPPLPMRILSPAPVPVPLPVAAPLQSSLLETPLSTLHALSEASSSSVSPPESVLSATSPTHMYARADELRKQAWKEDRAKTQLELDLAKARTQGRTKDVFILLGEIKAAQTRIDRLHMRAKRRYFRGKPCVDSSFRIAMTDY